MSAIGKIKASRVNNQRANTFVGQSGTLFFDAATGLLRFSDGVTPGGQPVAVALPPGTVSLGNLQVINTTITTFQPNVDLNLITNGTGDINLVGNIHVHPTNSNIRADPPIFTVTNTGQVAIIVPVPNSNTGQVIITGNAGGQIQTPINTGVMLQVTGQANNQSRIYNDANGGYAGWVGRRFNGTMDSPTQVLANQEITRVVGNGYTNAGWQANGAASMRIVAAENHTSTATGGRLEFWACPVGTTGNNSVRTAYIDANTLAVSGTITGQYIETVRNAGVIADAGTVTIDFSTDQVVKCIWGNGLNVAYSNFVPGKKVTLIATKATGTGTDSLSLDGISANNTSTGSTTVSGAADVTYIIDFYSTNSNIAGLYAKL